MVKQNRGSKIRLILLAVYLLTVVPVSVPAVELFGPEKLKGVETLELTVGMSFLLESYQDVAKVIVGDPRVADVRALDRTNVLINAARVGTTNLILRYNDHTTDVYRITVGHDISQIEKKLAALVPEHQVEISASNHMLIVDGTVDSQQTLDRIMTLLQAFVQRDYIKNMVTLKGSQQVQLEAEIVEVSRSAVKRYGLGFLMRGNPDGNQLGIGVIPLGREVPDLSATDSIQRGSSSGDSSGDGSSGDGSGGGSSSGDSSLDLQFPLASPLGNAFQLAFHLLNDDISGIISLLKGQGVAKIMARPTLVAMSGQEASFHVGGSFPVPTATSEGTGFNTQNYGVELEFIPTVTHTETISLSIKTSVSDIDFSTSVTAGGATVPGLLNREANSTLQLKDGQTFAIAGLLMENINSVVNKVPLLGDLPLLGAAFRSKEYMTEETELIILVTPRLVKAMNPGEVPPPPGDIYDFHQTDFDFFFLDNLWKQKRHDTGKRPVFSGPSGFEN